MEKRQEPAAQCDFVIEAKTNTLDPASTEWKTMTIPNIYRWCDTQQGS